jgi:hypothetical protein
MTKITQKDLEAARFEGAAEAYREAAMMVDLGGGGIPGATWQQGSARECCKELRDHFLRCRSDRLQRGRELTAKRIHDADRENDSETS